MLLIRETNDERLAGKSATGLRGYDPPSITDYVDAPTLQNASDAYAEKAEACQREFRVVDYDVDLLTTMDVRNTTATTTSTLIGTARDRLLGWAALETDADVSATFAQIARSASLIILLDYAWRVASSLRTVKKFLDKSAVQLPKARVQSVRSDNGFYAAVGWVVASPYPSLALVGAMGAAIFVGAAEPRRSSPPRDDVRPRSWYAEERHRRGAQSVRRLI